MTLYETLRFTFTLEGHASFVLINTFKKRDIHVEEEKYYSQKIQNRPRYVVNMSLKKC